MRKLALLLAILLVVGLVACGESAKKDEEKKPSPTPDTENNNNQTHGDDENNGGEDDNNNGGDQNDDPDEGIVDDGKFIEENTADFNKTFGGWEKLTLENSKISVGELLLISPEHTVDSAHATDIVRIKDYSVNGLSSVMSAKTTLNYVTMRKLQEMTHYMHEAMSVNYLYCVQAGYLTNAELNELNKNYPLEYPQKGGESALNTGYNAVVSIYTGAMNYVFRDNSVTNIAKWTEENAHKYGFVFLADAGENASLRYVGAPHAAYMKENNLDLDGYIEKLKDGEKLEITTYNDLTYTVYYVQASEGATTEIDVPTGMVYSVSGDNVGGFIVTVKGVCR